MEGHESHDRMDVLDDVGHSKVLHSADAESESNSYSTILCVCITCCHTDGSRYQMWTSVFAYYVYILIVFLYKKVSERKK